MIKLSDELARELEAKFEKSRELDEPARVLAAKLINERKTVDDLKEDCSEELRERVKETLLFTANQPIELNLGQQEEALSALEKRFVQNPKHYTRPEGAKFAEVRELLSKNPKAIFSLFTMQRTGGEPDVIEVTEDAITIAECSAESPDRRDFTYPAAEGIAKFMSGEIMDSESYHDKLQKIGIFDAHSRSMLKTSPDILAENEVLIGDRIEGEVIILKGVLGGERPDQGCDPRIGFRVKFALSRK